MFGVRSSEMINKYIKAVQCPFVVGSRSANMIHKHRPQAFFVVFGTLPSKMTHDYKN